jgi:hypothetical protein
MEALKELADLCKAEVSVSINPQKSTYESIPAWLDSLPEDEPFDENLIAEMVKRDRLVWVQAYPVTPIGFYVAYHWDIEEAIKQVLEAVKTR